MAPLSCSLLLSLARGPTILCTSLLCWLNAAVWVNPFPQMLQLHVTIPACCSSCELSVFFFLNEWILQLERFAVEFCCSQREPLSEQDLTTEWPFRLCQTSHWHQNKSTVLVWGPCIKRNLCFDVNRRFGITWMVTLHKQCRRACLYLPIYLAEEFLRPWTSSHRCCIWTLGLHVFLGA